MVVLIDLQNDYFDPRGKFYIPDTEELIQALLARIRHANETGEPIIYTLNIYNQKDGRSKAERDWAATLFEPFKALLEGNLPLLKEYYGISPDEAKKIIDHFGEEQPEYIEIAGVETQLCVMANAVIIQNMFPEIQIKINRKLVKANDADLEAKALTIMKTMNMEILED